MPSTEQPRPGILIVEDDSMISAALVRLLARRGHHAVAVGTVEAGLAQLDGQGFAILDLNLPDGSGTTILERIRAEGRPMRVAVVSGTTDEDLFAAAAAYRPDLLLRKPYDVNALVNWLNSAG